MGPDLAGSDGHHVVSSTGQEHIRLSRRFDRPLFEESLHADALFHIGQAPLVIVDTMAEGSIF